MLEKVFLNAASSQAIDLVSLKATNPRMNSLYQIQSKMLHGTKVIILVEKNRKRGSLAGTVWPQPILKKVRTW